MLLRRAFLAMLVYFSLYPVQAREFAEHQAPWRYGVFHFQEDRCYTAKGDSCEVKGLGLTGRRALDGYFLNFTYAHFRSGSEGMVGDLFSVGVSDEFPLGEQSWLTAHANLHFESDEDPPGNSNANGGYSIGADFSKKLGSAGTGALATEVGLGISYEDRQDCSNPSCNELRSRKGQMEILQARIYFNKHLLDRMFLTASISGIVSYPADDAFNEREQESPTLSIGLEFRP